MKKLVKIFAVLIVMSFLISSPIYADSINLNKPYKGPFIDQLNNFDIKADLDKTLKISARGELRNLLPRICTNFKNEFKGVSAQDFRKEMYEQTKITGLPEVSEVSDYKVSNESQNQAVVNLTLTYPKLKINNTAKSHFLVQYDNSQHIWLMCMYDAKEMNATTTTQ